MNDRERAALTLTLQAYRGIYEMIADGTTVEDIKRLTEYNIGILEVELRETTETIQ